MRYRLLLLFLLVVTPVVGTESTQRVAAGTPMPSPASRQYGDWTASIIGGGGYLIDVIATRDPQRWYLQPDVCGMYRSDDGGTTWRMLHGSLPARQSLRYCRGMAVDPQDPDRVLAAIGCQWWKREGILLSTDAGETWRSVLTAFFSANQDDRYDGRILVADQQRAGRFVAASVGDGLFESVDGGETWQTRGLTGTYPRAVLLDRADPRGIWVATWRCGRDLAGYNPDPGRTRFDSPEGLWRTTDGGTTWKLVTSEAVTELIQDPRNAHRLWAIIDHRRVAYSDDGGTTFLDAHEGLRIDQAAPYQTWSETCYQGLSSGADFLVVMSPKGTCYRRGVDDRSWTPVTRRAVHEPDGYWGYTPAAPSPKWGGINFGSAASSITVSPHDPATWFLTDWFSVYRSSDAGATWGNVSTGVENTFITDVVADPEDPTLVYATSQDVGLFRSADAGTTFQGRSFRTAVAHNVKSVGIPAGLPQRVYCLGNSEDGIGWYTGNLYRSDDRGITWRPMPMGGAPVMGERQHRATTVLVVDDRPDELWLCVAGPVTAGSGGLYRSRDGGETCTWMDAGVPAGQPFFRGEIHLAGHELARSPDGSWIALSADHGMLLRRDGDDQRFVPVPSPARSQLLDVQADRHVPGRFYLAAIDDGLLRSDDRGLTWRRLATPAATPGATRIALDPRVPGRLAIATANGVALSRDQGETWTVLDPRLPERWQWNVGAFAGDRLVVGSGGSGLFWIDVGRP